MIGRRVEDGVLVFMAMMILGQSVHGRITEDLLQCVNKNGSVDIDNHGNQNVHILRVTSDKNLYNHVVCVERNSAGNTIPSYSLYHVTCCLGDDLDVKTVSVSMVIEVETEVCAFPRYRSLKLLGTNDTMSNTSDIVTADEHTTTIATTTTTTATTTIPPLAVLQILDSRGLVMENVATDQNLRLRVQSLVSTNYSAPMVNQCHYNLLSSNAENRTMIKENIVFIDKGCSVQDENQLIKTNTILFSNNGPLEVHSTAFDLKQLYDTEFSYMQIMCEVDLCRAKDTCSVKCPTRNKSSYKISKKALHASVMQTIFVEKKQSTTPKPAGNSDKDELLFRGKGMANEEDLSRQLTNESFLVKNQSSLVLCSLIGTVLALVLIIFLAYKFMSDRNNPTPADPNEQNMDMQDQVKRMPPTGFPSNQVPNYLGNKMADNVEYSNNRQEESRQAACSPPPVYNSGSNLRPSILQGETFAMPQCADNTVSRSVHPVSPSAAYSESRSHMKDWTDYPLYDGSSNVRTRLFSDPRSDRGAARGYELPRRYQDTPGNLSSTHFYPTPAGNRSSTHFYPTPEQRHRLQSLVDKNFGNDMERQGEAAMLNAAIKEYFLNHKILAER